MNHAPVLIPLVFFAGALLIATMGRGRAGVAATLALTTTGAGVLLSVAGLLRVLDQGAMHYQLGGWQPPVGIELVLDPLSAFVSLVISGIALLVLWHSGRVLAIELPGREAPFLSCAMLLLGGLLGMVITGDLFNLYVFLEISSLASYALVALGDRRAPVSAFRYLMLGTVGASFYLLGLAFLFILTGSLNMADVARILPHLDVSPPLLMGVLLMILGLGLKLALFPLHVWLPDAYTHASSSATALIAPISTKVAAYALIRILFHVFDPAWMREESPVLTCIAYLGAAGIVWGSVMAIAQHDLKRMLAYSSVGQVGYIALGIGLASPLGLIGAVLHILNHACMKACLFLVSANFLTRLGHSDIRRLDHGVRVGMPWTSAAFALAAMSMIGLPPTAGFFSKWYLALGAFEAGAWILIAALLASTLLNAVYFFRILERIYLKPQAEVQPREAEADAIRFAGREVGFSMLTPTLVLAAGVLVLGLANALIVNQVIRKMIPAGL